MQYVVVGLDATKGLRVWGAFGTEAEAQNWGERRCPMKGWWVCEMSSAGSKDGPEVGYEKDPLWGSF